MVTNIKHVSAFLSLMLLRTVAWCKSLLYQLKLSEVYPVFAEEISLPGRIRDLDSGRDIDEEDEGDEVQMHSSNISRPLIEASNSHVGEILPLDSVDREIMNMSDPATTVAPQQAVEEVVPTSVVPEGDSAAESIHIPVAVVDETGSGQSDVHLTVGRPKRLCSKPKWMVDYES